MQYGILGIDQIKGHDAEVAEFKTIADRLNTPGYEQQPGEVNRLMALHRIIVDAPTGSLESISVAWRKYLTENPFTMFNEGTDCDHLVRGDAANLYSWMWPEPQPITRDMLIGWNTSAMVNYGRPMEWDDSTLRSPHMKYLADKLNDVAFSDEPPGPNRAERRRQARKR